MNPTISVITAAILTAAASLPCVAQNTAEKILVGDTKITVLKSYNGTDKLPRPAQTIVYTFSVPADTITIDESAAAHARTRGPMARMKGDAGQDLSPDAVATKVAQGFTSKLVDELSKTSIPTHPGDANAALDPQTNTLTVKGYFTAVNEGNKTKRMMIGLGRGASDVKAHVVVELATGQAPTTVAEFDVSSESGKKPGAAATMGAGAVAESAAANATTDNKATVEGDTVRMAKAVASEIESIMAKQQWIAPTK